MGFRKTSVKGKRRKIKQPDREFEEGHVFLGSASHTQAGGQQNHLSQYREEAIIKNTDSQAPFYNIEDPISTGMRLGHLVISIS